MTDDKPASRPYRTITDDLIMRIDAALEKTQGHRPHAAILLGLPLTRMHDVVNTVAVLRAKWGKSKKEVPETIAASDMHRDPAIPPFSREEVALVEAHAKESALWEKGMDNLNFTEEKRSFLAAVQANHGNHWRQMAQMFQGGVSYTATELLFQFNKLNAVIEDTYANPEKYERRMENQWGTYVTKTAHEVRMELTDRALAIADMFRKLNSDSERATLIAAQVEKLKVEQAQEVKARKQAKWSPKSAPASIPPIDV